MIDIEITNAALKMEELYPSVGRPIASFEVHKFPTLGSGLSKEQINSFRGSDLNNMDVELEDLIIFYYPQTLKEENTDVVDWSRKDENVLVCFKVRSSQPKKQQYLFLTALKPNEMDEKLKKARQVCFQKMVDAITLAEK